MTQFPHDQFAKEHLSSLLEKYGSANPSEKIYGESREIDVLFTPTTTVPTTPETLGLLGKLAQTICLFEVFRNPPTSEQILACLGKLFQVRAEFIQKKKAANQKFSQEELPRLWIITPTLSKQILKQFGAIPDPEWLSGMYFPSPGLKTGIIIVHQLPKTPSTLWIRLLGRGKVQLNAITELKNLSENDPKRKNMLDSVYALLALLKAKQQENQNIEPEEKVVIMKLATIFEQDLAKEKALGLQQGKLEGRLEAIQQESSFILRLITKKFGNLSPELEQQIRALSIEQLEQLGEDLLDFTSAQNLLSWLANNNK